MLNICNGKIYNLCTQLLGQVSTYKIIYKYSIICVNKIFLYDYFLLKLYFYNFIYHYIFIINYKNNAFYMRNIEIIQCKKKIDQIILIT